MKRPKITRDWFERRVAEEGDLEIGAGQMRVEVVMISSPKPKSLAERIASALRRGVIRP